MKQNEWFQQEVQRQASLAASQRPQQQSNNWGVLTDDVLRPEGERHPGDLEYHRAQVLRQETFKAFEAEIDDCAERLMRKVGGLAIINLTHGSRRGLLEGAAEGEFDFVDELLEKAQAIGFSCRQYGSGFQSADRFDQMLNDMRTVVDKLKPIGLVTKTLSPVAKQLKALKLAIWKLEENMPVKSSLGDVLGAATWKR